MKPGFIYEWTDTKTGLRYIGRHEGTVDDGYVGSGTIFIKEYKDRPSDFTREILWYNDNVSSSELSEKEGEFLTSINDDELYYGKNRKYYNQVRNSAGYTSDDNPMRHRAVVERMLQTRAELNLPNCWERTVAKYGYEEACRMRSVLNLGNTNGTGNKGKSKSEEHKAKISESVKETVKAKGPVSRPNSGRKPAVPFEETIRVWKELGYDEGAKYFGISRLAFYTRVLLAKKKYNVVLLRQLVKNSLTALR